MSNNFALPKDTELAGEYRIERMLGAGGFGITYLATEPKLARQVTIKEYFPVDFAARDEADDVVPRSQGSVGDYQWGLQRFLDEARTLAKFTHANIVGVHRYFEARSTGYMVLHYEKGQSLKTWLKALGRHPRQPELDRIVGPLLDALELIHAADFLHRDIAPDNIIIREDGSPVLIDFGSARGEVAKHSKSVSALVKPGYSPYEQYATSGRSQGPWTDIYSLGATLYHAIAGKRPLEAPSRMVADELKPIALVAQASYRPGFLKAIDHALALDVAARPQNVAAWRAMLFAEPVRGWRGSKAASAPAAVHPVPAASARSEPARVMDRPTPAAAADQALVPPLPPPKKPKRRGLIAEFRDGWRGVSLAPAASAVVALPPSLPPPPPALPVIRHNVPDVPVAKSVSPPPAASAPARENSATAAEPPRKAPPRQINRGGTSRWRGVAAKIGIGIVVTTLVVALQDQLLPHTAREVRKEGSGTVLSQTGEQVPLALLRGHRGAILGVAYSGDGRHIVSTAEDATVRVWSLATRNIVRTWALDGGPAAAFAVEGGRLVTGHRDGGAVVWNIETGAKSATLRPSGEALPVTAVAFTVEPNLVVVAHGRVVTVWDVRAQTVVAQLEGHEDAVDAVATSSRRTVATGSADRTVRLWNLADGASTRIWRSHGEAITALAFAPDGRRLASAALDGRIRITSTLTSRTYMTLRITAGRIRVMAFSPGGDVLATAGEDGTLRLWDLKRGRTIRSYQSHTGALQAIGYAPDGKSIAAAGADGQVRLWDATLP